MRHSRPANYVAMPDRCLRLTLPCLAITLAMARLTPAACVVMPFCLPQRMKHLGWHDHRCNGSKCSV